MTTDTVIKIFDEKSREYQALKTFAEMLNNRNTKVTYAVEDTYFDFGQNWKWTTLIAHKEETNPNPAGALRCVKTSWQALCPPDQFTVIYGTDSEKAELAQKLLNHSLCR